MYVSKLVSFRVFVAVMNCEQFIVVEV